MTATYTFDFADRQETLGIQVGQNPARDLVLSSSYLPSGPLTSLALGNGLTETRAFDDRYVPTRIQVASRLDWSYSTDGVGNVLSITDGLAPSQNRTYVYQDVHYFLTQGNGPWGTRSWSYDKIGNRLTETRAGVTDTYSYAANAAAGNTALITQISLGTGGTKTYAHGPAGHLTQVNAAGNQVIFESDAEGRLSVLERPLAGARTEMLYDGRSFLTEAVEPKIFSDGFESGDFSCWSSAQGATTTGTTCPTPPTGGSRKVAPTYSSEGLLNARTADDVSDLVLYFAGRPVAVLSVAGGVQQGLTYLTTDHLGTPALATEAAGTALWSGGFEPFGEDWNGAATAGVFLRFPGQWDDAVWREAGLGAEVYYNLHRWYQHEVGKYSRPDPLGLRQTLNPYWYVAGNPIRWTDPNGLAIYVCSRRAFVTLVTPYGVGNHSYLWDDRDGVPPSRRYCGVWSEADESDRGPGTDACNYVPGSEGREDEIMTCCRRVKADPGGIYFPPFNDCQNGTDDALECAGVPHPGVPGDRIGPPCDECTMALDPDERNRPFNPGRPGYRQSPL